MRLSILAVSCMAVALTQSHPALTTGSAPDATHHSPTAEELVGAWRLVSVETKRPNGEVIYPFYGRHPEGLLIYDRSGFMSVQIVSDPKPTVPLADSRQEFLAASAAEKAAAADGYYAYFGTWSIDPAASTVTHHILQSLYPAERGEDGIRRMSLEGSRLTLTAKAHEMGEDHQRQLVWERVTPKSP